MREKITKIAAIVLLAVMLYAGLGLVMPAIGQDEAPDILEELNYVGEQTPVRHDTDLPSFIGRIIKFAVGLVGIVLVAILIYAGFLYATSAGNEKQLETAKKTMVYAVIGIIIVAIAWALTDFVISALFSPDIAPTPAP